MKAITLWQPWASLIAAGFKTIETRGWQTRHRGWLAIHAAARRPDQTRIDGWFAFPAAHHGRDRFSWVLRRESGNEGRPLNARALPLGAVVAVARLTHCVPVGPEHGHERHIESQRDGLWLYNPGAGRCMDITGQLPYGDFGPGRFGWLLEDVRPLPRPVPWTGRQGLWDWTVDETLLWADLERTP